MNAARVALIGAGRWARAHRDALHALGMAPAAVLTSRPETAARVRDEWDAFATHELDAFLDVPSDAVIIASPNHLHVPHALACLHADRHVLVEKPLALDLAGADEVRAAAQAAGRVLAVGHEMRVFSLAEEARRVLHEGWLGAPRQLGLDLWRRPYRGGASGWKADPAKVGSTILEEPIHYLDLARWLLGDPSWLHAFATSRAGHEGTYENLSVHLGFGAEVQAAVTRSIAAWGHEVDLRLVGDEGTFRAVWRGRMDADDAPEVRAWLHDPGDRDALPAPHPIREASGHAFDLPRQMAAFLAAVAGEGPPPADGRDGREAVRLCLEAERSVREGRLELA
ncbi:MAG: Gfo/Idh/MocA family oxidoreductase [Trueperaceae bacterium]|nr:Gfo/Idh/MocA family oxidoreductase [Trueperaceae bacterium]